MVQKKTFIRMIMILCLLATGGGSARAYDYTYMYDTSYPANNPAITLHTYRYVKTLGFGDWFSDYDYIISSLVAITGSGDVEIPASGISVKLGEHFLTNPISAVGYDYATSTTFDVNSPADLSSLTFDGPVEIYGTFTLQNLQGELSFVNNNASTVMSGATLSLPRATALNMRAMDVKGTLLAPVIPSLNLNSKTTVSGTVTAQSATSLTVDGSVPSSGVVNTPATTQVTIGTDASIFGTINASVATSVSINSPNFYGTLKSNRLTSITLGNTNFASAGKIDCSSLRDIYIPDNASLPVFVGDYSSHFTAPSGTITVHVYDMTASQIAAMKTSATWNGFKQIVNHKSSVSYTLVNDGSARMTFIELNNPSYPASTSLSQLATIYSGSKTGTATAEKDYAVEIMDVDFDTKNVQLLRNGHKVTLQTGDNQGLPVRYYEDLNLMQDVRYELTATDKTCTLTFNQTGYTGRIMYEKTLNGTTTTGVVTSAAPTVTCARGSQLKLTIPYDQYTPNTLRVSGSTVTMTKANGEATATITVPLAATADVDLSWQEPQQTYTSHQPQIMIMRSGEGNVLFKGLCAPPEEQAQAPYVQQFGYPAENGIVVSAVSNCTNTVTTVTVPDYDYLGRGPGYEFDATEWGFQAEITPVAGQTLKTLLVGYIDEEDGREVILWEDMLYGENYGMYEHPEYRYVRYNESTNTYTFNWGFDEMNVWIGDYIVNIAMGPEETAVETGATLNFVRRGGRTEVLFEKEDVDGTLTDQVIGEGSTTFNLKYFTEAELDDAGMNYYQMLWFNPAEGETIRVFCDGTDITSQLVYNSQTGNARLDLERRNHTYTLLIEEASDKNRTTSSFANPDGLPMVLTYKYVDETTIDKKFSDDYFQLSFNDDDRQRVVYAWLRVPYDGQAVKVLRDGTDVTAGFTGSNNPVSDGYFEYQLDLKNNNQWQVSYDTSHRQTFVRKGGEGMVEVWNDIMSGTACTPLKEGVTTISLPPVDYLEHPSDEVQILIEKVDGEKVTVTRNGQDVTSLFTLATKNGKTCYCLSDADGDWQTESGFQLRDPAVWQIMIENAAAADNSIYDVNGDNKVDITDVTKIVNKILGRE